MINLITGIIFFALGFLSGYFVQKDKLQENITLVKRKIDVKLSPVGIVRRPTAEDLEKRTPMGKVIEEGKEEMRKTLEKIKELK